MLSKYVVPSIIWTSREQYNNWNSRRNNIAFMSFKSIVIKQNKKVNKYGLKISLFMYYST